MYTEHWAESGQVLESFYKHLSQTPVEYWFYVLLTPLHTCLSSTHSHTNTVPQWKTISSCCWQRFNSLMHWAGESMDRSSFKLIFRLWCLGLVVHLKLLWIKYQSQPFPILIMFTGKWFDAKPQIQLKQ